MMIGFTGPREGLLTVQHNRLKEIILKLNFTSLAHGGSVGSDTLMHYLVRSVKGGKFPIYILPADRDQSSIITVPVNTESNVILKPRPPLDRNEIIAEAIHALIAAPKGRRPEPRGGTWHTIRRAREFGKPILFVWPDGSATIERNDGV